MVIPAEVGTGVTLAFGSNGFTAEVVSANAVDQAISSHDVTHMVSANVQMIPGTLINYGAINFETFADLDQSLPPIGEIDTLAITYKTPLGKSAGAIFAGTGYIESYDNTVPVDAPGTANFTWRWDGKPKPTLTPAAA